MRRKRKWRRGGRSAKKSGSPRTSPSPRISPSPGRSPSPRTRSPRPRTTKKATANGAAVASASAPATALATANAPVPGRRANAAEVAIASRRDALRGAASGIASRSVVGAAAATATDGGIAAGIDAKDSPAASTRELGLEERFDRQ